MPAKINKSLSKEELARRAAQSKKDKAAAAQAKATPKHAKSRQPRARRAEWTPATRQRQLGLNRLAMSISCPQVTAPLRLPTVSRQKTDVKHLFSLGSVGYPSAPTNYFGPLIGQMRSYKTLSSSQAFYAVTRDPVAPGFATYNLPLQPAGATFAWHWRFAWDSDDYVLYSANAAPNTTITYSRTAPSVGLVSPGSTVPGTEMVSYSSTERDIFSVFGAQQQASLGTLIGPSTLWAAKDDDGATYCWHAGGTLSVGAFAMGINSPLAVTLPAGANINADITLRRWRGKTEQPEMDTFNVSIASGQSSAEYNWPSLVSGYYRLTLGSISVNNGGSAWTLANGLVLQFSAKSYMDYGNKSGSLLLPVPNDTLLTGSYMLEKARVNASALLVSNVSTELAKGGQLWGVRTGGRENFFTEFNLTSLPSYAGATGTGYSGPLATGGYTFLEPPPNNDAFFDHVQTVNGDITALFSHLELLDTAHVFLAQWSIDGGASATTLTFRFDQHIEFVSNSQLATPGITAMPTSDYTEATIALAAGNYFFENPKHLEQIWRWIKSAGASALRAGVDAASRRALELGANALISLL